MTKASVFMYEKTSWYSEKIVNFVDFSIIMKRNTLN